MALSGKKVNSKTTKKTTNYKKNGTKKKRAMEPSHP